MRLGLNVNQYAHYCDNQVCDTACCICVFLNCAHMYIIINYTDYITNLQISNNITIKCR